MYRLPFVLILEKKAENQLNLQLKKLERTSPIKEVNGKHMSRN